MTLTINEVQDRLAASLLRARQECEACLAAGGVFILAGPSQVLAQALPEDWLHEDDRRQAARYDRPADRANFIAGRHLLASLLKDGRSMAPLQSEPSGKPRPVNGVHFNLSHSETWVAVALSRTAALGVDIESRAGFERFAAVADRISHPDETAWVHAAGSARQLLLRRLEVWTRKEALLKASGEGLGFDAVRWSSLPGEATPEPSRAAHAVRTFTGPQDAWVLSVAYRSRQEPSLATFADD